MKKIFSLVVALLLLLTITGMAFGKMEEIVAADLLASPNTAVSNPAAYLADGDVRTQWMTAESIPGSAWAEIKLKEPVLITGLKFYGTFQGELAVEYWQGGWRTFMAARFLKGSAFTVGWNLLDLSFDRIVTDRLRLVFTNTEKNLRLGGIGEVKALGYKAGDILEHLDPISVTSNRRFESEYPVENLFDHNTYTSWRLKPGAPLTAEMVADLGGLCSIKRIKLFGADEDTRGDKLKDHTMFTVQYFQNNNWSDIPGMTNLYMTRIGAAWRRFDLDGLNIISGKIRVLMNGRQSIGGLKEMEIWGNHQSLYGSSYLFAGGVPVQLTGNQPANYNFKITKQVTGALFLHLAGMGDSSPLTWELNGKAMGGLTPASTRHGFVIYSAPLDAANLWDGANFIKVYGNNLNLYDCRLEIVPANKFSPLTTGSLTDRWLLSAAGAGDEVIDCGGIRDIDELILKSKGSFPGAQIAIERNGQWVGCNSPYRIVNDVSGSEVIYSGIGLAQRIKVSFTPTPEGFTELDINSSPYNDGPPQVRIFAPLDGEYISLFDWTRQTLKGAVDNPEATLKVNGHPVNLNGVFFEIPLTELGLKENEAKTIEAIVVDPQGRSGADRITVTVAKPPEFTVNLPEEITYTKDSRIIVSGKVTVPSSKVTVNGSEVQVINMTFTTTVNLTEGLNEIIIKVSVNDKWKNVNTKARYVVCNSTPPYLKVLNPVNGQIVGDKEITINGETSSLNPVSVTVNGQATAVSSGSFTSPVIPLTEGENRILVVATDQEGLTNQVELRIYRDAVKPELSNIDPLDNANLNLPTVTIKGTVLDASPVSVLINGKAATINNNLFTATVDLTEGWNNLTIIARDAAGNTKIDTRKVFIDTKPPAVFTPTADPSAWTNNNRPVISFATNDAESGIRRYEISIAGGSWTSDVSSPYRLPQAVPDGEQLIRVKAVDKAGNETTGEVKVYIDTVAPTAPEGFEVIPGIGKVTVKWQDPLGEIVGFRLTRTPAFTGTAYREFLRTSETGDKIEGYTDEEVTPGADYTYTLKAIDHAVNYGAATAPANAKVGIAVQDVSAAEADVKFDKCEVKLPENTFEESVKVVIQESTEELPENTYAAPVSPSYSFSVHDNSGVELKTAFTNPVTLTIGYTDLQIPEGFDDGDLGIYWYNKESGDWEKLEHVTNDFENKTLSVPLAHFSDYQVMASNYVSPSLDSYYNLGVSPYGSYFQDNVESVSPMSGSLSISSVDFKLPGRNGMDLIIKRMYDSGAAQQDKIIAVNGDSKAPVDTFGCGWSLNIPWIEKNDKGKFIRLPEGQTIKIDFKDDAFEYHEGAHFILKQRCERSFWSTKILGYTLVLKDGTIYEFDDKGKVTKQIDPSGMNYISYNYNQSNSRQLDYIEDSVKRNIYFIYKQVGSKYLIGEIDIGKPASRKVTFDYDDYGNLHLVHDPKLRTTTYSYLSKDVKEGYSYNRSVSMSIEGSTGPSSSCNVNKITNYKLYLLSGVEYPSKGSSTYNCDLISKEFPESWYDATSGVIETTEWVKDPDDGDPKTLDGHWEPKRYNYEKHDSGSANYCLFKVLVKKQTISTKETEYTYNMNQQAGSLKDSSFIPPYNNMLSCTVTEGDKTNTETYKLTSELAKNLTGDSGLTYSIGTTGNEVSYSGNVLINREILNHGANYETIKYNYESKQNLSLHAPSSEEHYRNGKLIYTIINNYDSWGNLTYRFDSSRHAEETWQYKSRSFTTGGSNFNIQYLVSENVKCNWNPVSSKYSTVTTTYTYKESVWKPDSVKVNDGNQIAETTYSYYDTTGMDGSLKTKSDPNGLETEYIYDSNGFPSQKIYHYVKDADNKLVGDIITKYHYIKDTGMKEWEEDPRGDKTTYEYDALNRITKVILPDDDTDASNNPYRKYEFYDTPDANGYNYCIFRDENGKKTRFNFDGLGRLVEVIKNENKSPDQQVKTTYHYDNLGRIDKVTDPRQFETKYEYDALNRVSKVTYPSHKDIMGNDVVSYVTLDYQDLTNTVIITEENGINDSIVTEKSDWANRLIQAVQNCKYKGITEHDYSWYFDYDSLGNKIRQVDPLAKEIDQVFDPLGHLTEVDLPAATLMNPETYQTEFMAPKVTYEYDIMGNRTGETNANGNKVTKNIDKYKTDYTYDELGRVISVTKKSSDGSDTIVAITKNYYDAAGNKVRAVTYNDNDLKKKLYQDMEYTYSARGFLLSEDLVLERDTDGKACKVQNLGRYRYDPLGNKTATIDPRNKADAPLIWYSFNVDQMTLSDPRTKNDMHYTTWYLYNDLNQLYRTILPLASTDNTLPDNPYISLNGTSPTNPYTETTYDKAGNKITERDVNGLITEYAYYPRNWVQTVKQGNATDSLKLKATYYYDARGNQTEVVDALNNVTVSQYDSLGRLRQVTHPVTAATESYEYDGVGNKSAVTDGNTHTTQYSYNAMGWLTGVLDPLGGFTEYQYDPNGNQVKRISAGNLTTINYYDEQNRLTRQTDSLGNPTTYNYDVIGNRVKMVDRRFSTWVYQYYPDNLLKRIDVSVSEMDGSQYWVEYQYDAAGNRTNVTDNGGKSITYSLDELNRTNSVTRSINDKTYSYTTAYHYNSVKSGLLDGITYPEAIDGLQYMYNDLNQLSEVVGFTKPQGITKDQGITYYEDGALKGISYINNTTATYTYDDNRRLDILNVQAPAGVLFSIDYQYDGANNITKINDREYHYDDRNQLTYAKTPGKFMETDPTPGDAGYKAGDYLGDAQLGFTLGQGNIKLDYDASSIGVDFGITAPKIKKILLIPDKDHKAHRLTRESLELYTSSNNSVYTAIPRSNWEYAKDENGVVAISFKDTVATRYLKLHVKFDNRNNSFAKVDKASFLNDLAKMLQVYQEADARIENYTYTDDGNRSSFTLQLVRTAVYTSQYYTNSDRLKTDGKYAYVYDRAGNLTKKGNKFSISGDTVTFTATSGEEVEYWQYTYDLLNRLIKVEKNGKIISEYEYDPEGLRVVKKAYDESGALKDTIHYVFEGTEPIFEKSINTGKVKSYVYLGGKLLARVDGVMDTPANLTANKAPVYFYHTDHLGSVKAVTDKDGKKVFDADYEAFGKQYGKNVTDASFDEWRGFNGKEYDQDIGLYYYNARWYDSETGRFISEDPAADPNNPNLYSYCANNPINLIDPTGTVAIIDDDENGNPITDPSTYLPPSSTVPLAPNNTVSVTIDIPNYIFGVNATFTYNGNKQIVTYTDINNQRVTVTTEVVGNTVTKIVSKIGSDGTIIGTKTITYTTDQEKYISVENPGGERVSDQTEPSSDQLFTVGGYQIDYRAVDGLIDMVNAARIDGINLPLLNIASGYRPDARQKVLWDEAINEYKKSNPKATQAEAEAAVVHWVARPGTSNHRSGRAVDFQLEIPNQRSEETLKKQRQMATFQWLDANAASYGFYNYPGEAWHWEYNPPAN